jgi:tetratricopeptide (TPR) repeat protein
MRTSTVTTAAVLMFVPLFLCNTPARAQDAQPDKARQIAELTERVAALEQRLTELEEQALPLIEQARNQQRRDKAKAAARTRMRQDRGKYSPEVLGQVEQLYQTANKNWRSPQAVAALKKLVNEYPDLNRTGCATLYLGQMAQGPEKVDYLTRAMTDFGDCYYGDGVNVGAYAAFQLACYQYQQGDLDQARNLIEKIETDHPDAIDHRGRALVDLLTELQQSPPGPANEDTAPQQ